MWMVSHGLIYVLIILPQWVKTEEMLAEIRAKKKIRMKL